MINDQKGFTIFEILLVVGVIVILISFTLPLGLDFYKNQQLETQSQGIVQALRGAQLKAMAIELDSPFGVYLTNDNYILFKGPSYAERDSQYDEVFDLPEIINVSGLNEIVFSKFEGMPNTIGNIILNTDNLEKKININEIGRINLEQ